MEKTTLYIVRHGETLFNKFKRIQGWSDSPLTDLGIKQAEYVSNYLKDIEFEKVYSSDLKRAIDTTDLILGDFHQNVIHRDYLLRETFYGGFEGANEEELWSPIFEKYGYKEEEVLNNFYEIHKKLPLDEARDLVAQNDDSGLSENFNETNERINSFIEKVSSEKIDGNILIVCHGGTSQLLINNLFPDNEEIPEPFNCSITKVEVKDNNNSLLLFNDTSHL